MRPIGAPTGAALAVAALVLVLSAPAAGRSHNVDCDCWDVSVIGVDGKGARLVLANQSVRGWNIYDVSPDRRALLFSHGGLYRARIDGRLVQQISGAPGGYSSARWSPNGDLIAMSLSPEGSACAAGVSATLVVTNPYGARRRHVADCAYEGSWSPDSRRLVFARLLPSKVVLTVARADGTHARNIATSGRQIVDVAWAPRGGWIAYMASNALHVVRADGSEDDFLARVNNVLWSPNGRRLAVMLKNGESRSALYVMNRDGRRRIRVAGYALRAAWSPDGRRLAYAGCHVVTKTDCRPAYYVVDANGRSRRELAQFGPNAELGPIYWSRDGKRIIYLHDVQSGE